MGQSAVGLQALLIETTGGVVLGQDVEGIEVIGLAGDDALQETDLEIQLLRVVPPTDHLNFPPSTPPYRDKGRSPLPPGRPTYR